MPIPNKLIFKRIQNQHLQAVQIREYSKSRWILSSIDSYNVPCAVSCRAQAHWMLYCMEGVYELVWNWSIS